MDHESDGDSNCNCYSQNYPQKLGKETGRVENLKTSGDDLNYSIVKIEQNTEKNRLDLRRHTVTQTQVKDNQIKLRCKIRIIIIIIMKQLITTIEYSKQG